METEGSVWFGSNYSKDKMPLPGWSWKETGPEFSKCLLDWFIDDRNCFKARLTISLFKSKINDFYDKWVALQR